VKQDIQMGDLDSDDDLERASTVEKINRESQ